MEFENLIKKKISFASNFYKIENLINKVIIQSGKVPVITEANLCDEWNTSTLSFLNLLKLNPPQPIGRKITQPRDTDVKAINKFIILKNVRIKFNYTILE